MLRLWTFVYACAIAACTSAQMNAPGTADPGISSPGVDEVGQSASQNVGAAGGSVGTPSQSAFAAVPPGALGSQLNLSVQVQSPTGMPQQETLLANVYDFGPDGTAFSKPVVLTVTVANGPASGRQAMLAYLDANQTWQALLDSTYNPSTGAVTATTTHFTAFTVVAFSTDGNGCTAQIDSNAFCSRWKLICNPYADLCGPPTYTVGGSVTGLGGSLSLTDNLGDVVVVTEDGNFTFPTGYNVGEGYVAGIGAQPQNQNCRLTGDTGMVTTGAVQSIQVICEAGAPMTFAVGGKVQGLDANESVTLTLGAQSYTAAGNGDFVFPGELALNANYSVAVATSPTGKSCAVTQHAAGTVYGVTLDIEVACGTLAPVLTQVGGHISGMLPGAMVVLENLADPNDIVAVAGNGNFIVSTNIFVGEDFNIVVTTQPVGRKCRVTGGAGVATADMYWGVMVTCSAAGALQFATAQNASVVLGEPDFVTSNTLATLAADLLVAPAGSAYLASDGALYVGDTGAYRALVYNMLPTTNGAAADGVLGQQSATLSVSLTPANAGAGSGHFAGIGGGGNTLLLADPFDNRVLVFAGQLPASNANASRVLGQSALAHLSNAPACGAAGLSGPMAATLAGNRVVVADTNNDRVLVYNTLPAANGAAANVALGQPDLNTCTSPGTASAAVLKAPQAVWSDGNRLLVADTGNHRVLVWLTFPTRNQQPADAVIGQANFVSNGPGSGNTGTKWPTGVTSDGSSIWISSAGYHRVEQWPFPTAAGAGPAATAVLGQRDFTGTTPNACNCSIPNALGLDNPGGVSVAGDKLVVTDTGNNRVLIFASE